MARRTTRIAGLGLAVAMLLALLPGVGLATDVAPGQADGATQIIVRPDAGESWTALARRLRAAGATHVRAIGALGAATVDVPGPEVASRVAAVEGVASVEPDPVVALTLVPNDDFWDYAWGMEVVQAPAAWDLTTGSDSVVIAVLDTGVDPSHPDLSGALLPGRDVVNGDTDASDDQGHGTMAAGIVGARGDNGRGVAGACWRCRILPVKVLAKDGLGTSSDAAAGIVWATDHGADIISMSFGSPDTSGVLEDAVDYAHDHGVLLVAAVGNEGINRPAYPAGLPAVVGVAGSKPGDGRYEWSNYGNWVDVAAPGCNATTMKGGGYGEMCGTSSATPLVAGIAALLKSRDADAGPARLAQALAESGVDVSYVAGTRVNASAAIAALGVAPAPEPEPEPVQPVEDDPVTSEPAAACPASVASTQFSDVSGTSVHTRAIECIVAWGIASGLDRDTYGPSQKVTRAQMATFVSRVVTSSGIELPVGPDRFADDDGDVHESAINALANVGIVSGVSTGRYAPDATVSRAQMATFLVRAFEFVAAVDLVQGGNRFRDDNGNPHELNIDKAATAGFAAGVGDGRYDPDTAVRRDQMATFLARVLERMVADGLAPAQAG